MRRTVILVLPLACVAMVLWWLGGAIWPRGGADGASHPEGGPEDPALLRGRASEPPPATKDPRAPVPDPPPDWPYGTVTGGVVGPDGEPLRDSGVAAIGALGTYGAAIPYRDTPADADGRFELHVQAGLSTVVVAGALGHALLVGPRVQLEAGATRDVGTLQLERERRIAVRVVDDKGTPVEDVDVYLATERDPQPEGWEAALVASELLESRATDADGRVLFDMLPGGTWRVSIDTGATITCDQVREHVEANGEVLLFVLPLTTAPDTLRVHVRALGPDGEPVPRVCVKLASEDCSNSDWWEAGESELFELECATGPVRLVVDQAHDADGTTLGYAPVVISDVRAVEDPVVVRMERGATITGRVAWEGDPATWRVSARGWFDTTRGLCEPTYEDDSSVMLAFGAQTEADGSFCLLGLPPGRYTVVATGPGRLRGRAPVIEAGTTGTVLHLEPEGRIEVHVLAPKGLRFGTPYLSLGEWVGEGLQGRSGWFGGGGDRPDVRIFEVDDLRLDGRYRLTAWGNCSGVRCPAVVLDDVVPREAPYVLQLEDTMHVRGVVEREDGTPVWGAQVHHLPWPGGEFATHQFGGGPWIGFAMTDRHGAFDLSGIGEREMVLGVSGLGVTLRDPPPSVPPGTSGIRLVVVPARRISGRITDPSGGSLDGLYATAVPDRGPPGLWTPDRVTADGFFELRGLPPGTYRVLVWNARDATDVRSALSAPVNSGQGDVRLELAPGAVLEGVVRDAAARPLPGAAVRLLGRWTNRGEETDGEGRFRFVGIPIDVELEMEVVTPTGRSVLRTVKATEVEEPTTLDVTLPKR